MKNLFKFYLSTVLYFTIVSLGYAQCTWTSFQTEGGTWSSGTTVDSDHSGYTGTGFVNTANKVGAWFEVTIYSPSAGNSNLRLRHANAKSGDRTVSVSVNGVTSLASLSLPSTGSWTTWVLTDFNLPLQLGNNIVRLTALTSGGVPNADRVDACLSGTITTYQLTTSAVGEGTVSPSSGTYNAGLTATLTATPAAGWLFGEWSGGASGTTNPITVTMNSDKAITAIFTKKVVVPYTLTTSTVGSGSISLNPSGGVYNSESTVIATAAPAAGWQFNGWSGAATGAINPVSIFMDGNKTLTATFSEIPGPTEGPVGWASINYLGQNGTTGGAGGPVIDINDFTTFQNQAKIAGPKILVIHGTINAPSSSTKEINVMSNITIVGAGSGAFINFGLHLRGNNIIVQNMDIWNGGQGDAEGYDGIGFSTGIHHIWVDHCTVHECRDGAIDPTYNCRLVTISYCRFFKQNKTMLICGGDGDSDARAAQSNADKRNWHYTVTVHHCWFDQTGERHPRVRFGAVHAFNNYIDNTAYGIGKGDRANVYSEATYFFNTKEAFKAWDDAANPGYIEDVNSLFEGENGNMTDNPPTGDWVWTPSQYYAYSPHSAAWVKDNLKNLAGVGKINASSLRITGNAYSNRSTPEISEEKASIILYQNYPNPVENSTIIGLWLKEQSRFKITLYNALGKKVTIIADKKFEAGYNEVKFQNNGLKSGVYIYQVRADKIYQKRQMIIK